MIVVADKKVIILRVDNPNRVKQAVPDSVIVNYNGHDLVMTRHDSMTRLILNNMGIKVPSVLPYYNWPGLFTPFEVQRNTVDFLTLNPRAFCLNDLGTGKTSSVLWAYDYLRRQNVVNRMLVVSPLSTLQRTWADEAFRTLPHRKVVTLHGSKEKRLRALASDADIYIINHHGVEIIKQSLVDRKDIDIVVIDELATYRNCRTMLWKAMNAVVKDRQWVWGLTGTPTPNSPVDAYGQIRLINPSRVPYSARAFRDMVMVQQGQFKWVPRRNAQEVVSTAMQPAIRYTRDQCIDLPPVIYMNRDAPLTPEQAKAYDTMKRQLVADVQGSQVVALNEAVKLLKLVQIACGVVYDGSGGECQLDRATRADVVREIIEQSEGKVIVFAPFKSVVNALFDDLAKDYECAKISGDTPSKQRNEVFHRVQHDPALRVVVASPSAMSHGLTLTEANTVVWYAPVNSNEVYQQANARISRAGQTRTQFVVNISATPVERAMYKRLQSKQAIQGSILELIQAA